MIYSAGRITLDEIRVRWQRNEMSGGEELPRKTFENHRKAVEELFDVNIACDRRTNEYYVECGDDMVRDDLRRWLLETFAVNDLLVNSKRLRRRIALEPIPSGYTYLTTVLRAMEENRCLEIVYRHTYDEKRENRYEVEPYGLKAFRRRWYLIADSVEMGGIYAFALFPPFQWQEERATRHTNMNITLRIIGEKSKKLISCKRNMENINNS